MKDMVLIGIVEINEANRLIDKMKDQGIELEANFNRKTCSGGCRTMVELRAKEENLGAISKMLQEEHLKLFEGMEINPEFMNQVYDTGKKEARCPACGTKFETSKSECPECGLNFSIPEEG